MCAARGASGLKSGLTGFFLVSINNPRDILVKSKYVFIFVCILTHTSNTAVVSGSLV